MRFATRLLVKNNSRKVAVSKSSRGVVRAIKRQCLWKRASVVIGPFLPKRYALPFQDGCSGCVRLPDGRGGQVSQKSGMALGRLPVSTARDDKSGVENYNPQKT